MAKQALPAPPGFVWRDEFVVGVAEIDEQHRRLVGMIGSFYAAVAADTPHRAALRELLRGLADYTRYHFATEERLMDSAQLPVTRAHRKQHQAFVAKVADMADRIAQGKLVLSVEATTFLRDWLSDHILGTDKQLGRELRARGVR